MINGSDWIQSPFNETFRVYTDFFHDIVGFGMLFWIIPIAVIGLAIYIKTGKALLVSMYLLASGVLFSAGNIFVGGTAVGVLFIVIAAAGIAGLIYSMFINQKGDR
jgi:hypothetical protein